MLGVTVASSVPSYVWMATGRAVRGKNAICVKWFGNPKGPFIKGVFVE
jgi:hypothetical protein